LTAFSLAACGGERPHHRGQGAMGPAGPEGGPPVRRMEARVDFFGGQIEVETLLARAGVNWSRTDDKEGVSGASGRSGHGGGMRAGFSGGGGGMRGGYGGGRGGGHGGRGDSEGGSGEEGPRPPPIRAINQAPIELRLRLTNHGGTPCDVEVVDFNSALGDFAVQPEQISLKPGDAIEAEPMVSRLGVPSEEVPLTVKLRVSDKTEQQVLTLRVVPEPPPRAEHPPPAGAASTPAPPPAP